MDDRFDFQLVTGELMDDEGLSYISNSYRAFGNDGTHFCCNSPITTGTGASPTVLTALTTASDHIPVVADYQLPAKMMASLGTVPTNVLQGDSVDIDVMVENIANVLTSIGADELDYTISVSGALAGGLSDIDFALGGGNTHQIALDTSVVGPQSGTVTVTTSSQSAANTLFTLPVNFTVDSPVIPQVIAKDDFDSTLNLNSFSQTPAPGAFSSNFDGFETYQVGVSSSIPAALIDDSTNGNPGDTQGIVDSSTKTDAWFGVTDVANPDNPGGSATATWEFDISGATDLEVSIDMAAMGDFQFLNDLFIWSYSVDGGNTTSLFTSSIESTIGSLTYTLADGDQFTLNDPIDITNTTFDETVLSNAFQTITSVIPETGNTLTISLVANTNDDNDATARAYAFDNIVITGLMPLRADFNNDDVVDDLDLAQWEGDYGLNGDSDANGDGFSNGLDFLIWQEELGSTALVAAVTSVPEPHSFALALLGLVPVISRNRQHS